MKHFAFAAATVLCSLSLCILLVMFILQIENRSCKTICRRIFLFWSFYNLVEMMLIFNKQVSTVQYSQID